MRWILTGGTGLIGRGLAQRLVAAGDEVIALSRRPEEVRAPVGVRIEPWDGRSAQGWARLVDGAAGIVNLAGESIGAGRWSTARKEHILRSRVDAGRAVCEAVRNAGHRPDVVVQISGVGYYGPGDDRVFDESAPSGADFLAQVAVAWEEASRPVEDWGVRRVILRTGMVLAKEGGALARMMLPFRFFAGGPLGSGWQWLSWIHLEDAVSGLAYALTEPTARGAYNLCAPEALTNASFGRMLAAAMRRPYWLPAPAWALRVALGEMSTLVLDGQRVFPQRLLQAGFDFRYPRLDPALRDLLPPV